jgi:membrane protease YdiL (CAAX protease family)
VLEAAYAVDVRLIYLGGSALFLLLAAAAEEIVFRGVLLQFNAAFTRNAAILIAVNGLVFSAFHFDPSPGAFVARAVSGAVWSWTVLRLSGLEFAIGAHLANNLALSLLVEPISEGARPGRDYPLSVVAADIVTTLAVVFLLKAALRSPRIRAWAEADPSPPARSA